MLSGVLQVMEQQAVRATISSGFTISLVTHLSTRELAWDSLASERSDWNCICRYDVCVFGMGPIGVLTLALFTAPPRRCSILWVYNSVVWRPMVAV